LGVLHSLNDNDAGIKSKISSGNLEEGTKTKAFYNVLRMSKDVLSRSQVGFIAMSKEFSGGYNRILGLDGNFRFNNYYTFSYEAINSFSNIKNDKSHSINLSFDRQTDFFSFAAIYSEQAPGFLGNEIGFYSYNNFREGTFWFDFRPRLESIGIRQFALMTFVQGENFWSNQFLDYNRLSRSWGNNFYVIWMNYWVINGGWDTGKSYDRFDETLYPSDSYYIALSNNHNSKVYFNIHHSQRKYRTGYSWSYNNSVYIRPVNRINLELSYDRSLAKLVNPESNDLDHHKYEVWRSKLNYCFNRDLNARLILQYNGMEKRLDTYYLIAYNFRPKSFLYLAYTERFDETAFIDRYGEERIPRFSSSNKIFQLKLSYLFLR
jgi:hypothetical protein